MKKFFCLVLLLVSCSFTSCSPVSSSADAFLLNTYVSVSVYGGDADYYIDLIKKYDSLFDVTVSSSEISKLNRQKEAVISDDILSVITQSLFYSALTDGAFDVTVYPVMKLWAFDSEPAAVPASSSVTEALSHVGYDNITVADSTVTLLSGTEIDLGGIAKGYISDRLYEKLQDSGVKSALISLGGNVICFGSKPNGAPWKVGIASPSNPEELIGTVSVTDSFVITSGDYQRYFIRDGIRYHHILDPATGYPAVSDLHSVTVISDCGTEADALSTALFVMGKDRAIAFAESHHLRVILITDDTVFVSETVSFTSQTEFHIETIKAS